jgi:hypothetical protein
LEKTKKRAKRRYQTFTKMRKRLKDVKETCKEYYKDIIKRHREGHFRKSSTYDCGSSRCFMCHFDKLIGKRPLKERQREEEAEYEEIRRT